jgi:hypothetical protein
MRRTIVAALAAAMLGGCMSIIEGAYDDHAESECAEITDPSARRACLDAVDERRRERD